VVLDVGTVSWSEDGSGGGDKKERVVTGDAIDLKDGEEDGEDVEDNDVSEVVEMVGLVLLEAWEIEEVAVDDDTIVRAVVTICSDGQLLTLSIGVQLCIT